MRVVRHRSGGAEGYELVDDDGNADPLAASFATAMIGRGCSPHTVSAYIYDLRRFYRFLGEADLTLATFRVAHSVELLAWLGRLPSPRARLKNGSSASFAISTCAMAMASLHSPPVISTSW